MSVGRVLRYLAPNLITLSSMIFGLVSLWSAHNDDPALAAWMIIYAVLTDDALDLAVDRQRLPAARHEQLEQELGPDRERSTRLDERAAARDVLRVVREKRV